MGRNNSSMHSMTSAAFSCRTSCGTTRSTCHATCTRHTSRPSLRPGGSSRKKRSQGQRLDSGYAH
eukprot:1697242-Alexandrium_andersonii.AAC.1